MKATWIMLILMIVIIDDGDVNSDDDNNNLFLVTSLHSYYPIIETTLYIAQISNTWIFFSFLSIKLIFQQKIWDWLWGKRISSRYFRLNQQEWYFEGKSTSASCPLLQIISSNLFLWGISPHPPKITLVISVHLRPSHMQGFEMSPGHFLGSHGFPGKNIHILSGLFF